ncbi:hypothetical protein KJ910_00530 [Patescibacteria group bacterium]|nr:hypothetical protein [Patescibacteria group bacterium]MBU1906940.1 hypothetical protein [Patescibacteria group bacterium]
MERLNNYLYSALLIVAIVFGVSTFYDQFNKSWHQQHQSEVAMEEMDDLGLQAQIQADFCAFHPDQCQNSVPKSILESE